ncbi:MAG: PQQ-binding-like beta-propeller repeat protein, partial [Acidobacteriota bacterium]
MESTISSQFRSRFLVGFGALSLCAFGWGCSGPVSDADWPSYQGGSGRNQHSVLDQINRANVSELKLAWEFRTGDAAADNRSQIQCNSIIVEGRLYATSPTLKVFALDAATGEQIWLYDPFEGGAYTNSLGVSRGVMYWESGGEKRILFTAGPHLHAVDAESGKPIAAFGESGKVDLREHLDRPAEGLFVSSNSPGVIYKDLVILGTRVSEGPGPSAPGHIRAYSVRTGELAWVFRTIPRPGEFGYETWPEEAWKTAGGANSWAGMALDEERGIVYAPTGSPAFDFWGGDRAGENLFGNCILALNAETGERIWHYQIVRHDLWDRDLPAPPNLITVDREGRKIDALAQITKSGHVFVLNRETGEPLFPVEEFEVPPSDLKGEQAWPAQRFPTVPEPFARQVFTTEDATKISPESHSAVLEQMEGIRTGGQFIPPSVEGTMIFPGFDGGGEWGGAAFDPETGVLYVNSNEMPWILTMVDIEQEKSQMRSLGAETYSVNCGVCHGPDRKGDSQNTYPPLTGLSQRYTASDLMAVVEHGKGFMPGFAFIPDAEKKALVAFLLDSEEESAGGEEEEDSKSRSPYSHTGYNRFLDPEGYPAVEPPWGTLNAIDLNSGRYRWKRILGEFKELTESGIPPTGT